MIGRKSERVYNNKASNKVSQGERALQKLTEEQVKVSVLEEVLEANRKFVKEVQHVKLSHFPLKNRCSDVYGSRLVDFLELAMGLERGDAKIIKNAGNTASWETWDIRGGYR